MRLLFVCTGNICRSPTAEAVARARIEALGLDWSVDSAGTSGWHEGEPPDPRSQAAAAARGYSFDGLAARALVAEDFTRFDHILAMDKSNLHDILYLDTGDDFGHRVTLFRQWDPEPGDYEVPDPYYGGDAGFENVYEIVDRTAEALLKGLAAHYELAAD